MKRLPNGNRFFAFMVSVVKREKKRMSIESKSEMERIQKNLEQFVDDGLKTDLAFNRTTNTSERKKVIRDLDEVDVIEVRNKQPSVHTALTKKSAVVETWNYTAKTESSHSNKTIGKKVESGADRTADKQKKKLSSKEKEELKAQKLEEKKTA